MRTKKQKRDAKDRPNKKNPSTPKSGPTSTHLTKLQRRLGNQGMERYVKERDCQLENRNSIRQIAATGVSGTSHTLPYIEQIEASFGHHDISDVRAYSGGRATDSAESLDAHAYTWGKKVAFSDSSDLYTAAHEAAHVVQQRSGVSVGKGITDPHDRSEKQADRVGNLVVTGRSAEDELDTIVNQAHNNPVGNKIVQRDLDDASYSYSRSRLPGQRSDQTRQGRALEIETEQQRSMSRGATDALRSGDYNRQVDVLETNATAVYETLHGQFRVFANATVQAHNNMQNVLNEVNRQQQENESLVNTIIDVALAVLSEGAGAGARGAFVRVVGRFDNVNRASTDNDAILESLTEIFRQGIQVGGQVTLRPDSHSISSPGTATKPSEYRDKGLSTIENEKATILLDIAWLRNNREELEGNFQPATLLSQASDEWAWLITGAFLMGSSADTREIERDLWREWIRSHGVEVRSDRSDPPLESSVRYTVPDLVEEHLTRNLGVSESTIRDWTGIETIRQHQQRAREGQFPSWR